MFKLLNLMWVSGLRTLRSSHALYCAHSTRTDVYPFTIFIHLSLLPAEYMDDRPPPYDAQPQRYSAMSFGQAGYQTTSETTSILVHQPPTVQVVHHNLPKRSPLAFVENNCVNHLIHCLISFHFFPWFCVWIYFCYKSK
jgi:hypothetical protein